MSLAMANTKSQWLHDEQYFGSRPTLLVTCVTITLSYLVPHLVGRLTSNPQTVWPLWPGCAILVSGLLLVRVTVWPLVISASFAGFALADLQAGVAVSSIARFIPGNTVELLISAVGLRYAFDGLPRLNSVKALAKYSLFAIILGPLAGAFFSAHGIARDYWTGWKIVFLSEVLAFITLTPALLSWVTEGRALLRRSRAHHLEGVVLIVGLILVSYIVFTVPVGSRSPALFYALVPFLLWSALRFGWLGVSTSLIVVTSLSIWGAVYGRGPFSSMVPLTDPLPLQLFLVFASIPFMVLATLAEEHREAANVVHQSEERLRLAQSAAHIGTFDLNLRTGVDIWQPETEALFGLPPGSFGRTLAAFEDLIHPDDRKKMRELTQETIRTGQGKDTDAEYRVVWPDGSVHWIAGRGRLLTDASGEPTRMVGVNMDITERKFAEQELAITADRLRLAIEAGSVGGWDFDLKTGKSVWFGKSHAQLGMTADETVGSSEEFWERVHEDDRDDLRHAMRIARVRHEEFIHEFRAVGRDGTTRWLRSRGRYQYADNGEPERLLGLSIDITESKQAEQALCEMNRVLEAQSALLRSGQELLKVFVKNVPAAVAMLDRDMRYLQVSDRWCSDYLHGRAQVLGHSHHETFPDIPERWKEVHRRALQGETLRAAEDRWDGRDGPRWARWEVRPWRTSEGAVGGILIFAEDITQRKRMEEALSDVSRKLIQSQERERTRIARELHDDINQRLALLSLEIHELQKKPSDVQKGLQRLLEKTDDISSDVHALSHELHSSKLEYLGGIAGIKSWCKEFAERHRMEIDFKNGIFTPLPFEVGLSLFRVIQEALHNAQKHSGVRRVEVDLAERSNEVHLTVSDSGRGFDLEAAKQGSGLGLTTMRERVRLIDGTISIESRPKGGATIHVRVPLQSKHDSQRAAG